MSEAPRSTFVYVTYIRTSAQKLWSALTSPEFNRQYWFGMHIDSEWSPGAAWTLRFTDGGVADSGEVLEFDPPRRLALSWRHEFWPELKADGPARCTFDLEPDGEVVKLTVTHTSMQADSKLIAKVSGGWPKILSNLKSLLETGQPVATGKLA
ncbi:MAG TPA: SRPBCC family protein [Steroidobacteraceae bacterium]|nr:SRPBCC family protein [Steroidobacteraceae bacterium]